MNKLIINFTPNGMIPTKDLTPHVPISPDEIISEAIESTKFGVSMIHLHARDQSGNPTYQKEIYEQIVGGIKKINKDIII
ncbi:MAG TPA: 3-keto-5-aminohexanoate cleavage protein, partial [Chloroflexi bacterium]|nr:3-keto-5-aminohexanoate cleavage protein [Chloroflexota bacterium]